MMPATKVAGFARKNLALNILAAKLQKELHGEKMLLTKHLQGLCKGSWRALHCGNKEPFGMAVHSGRCGMSGREEAAVPGFLCVFF